MKDSHQHAKEPTTKDKLQHLRELVVGPTNSVVEELRDEVRNRTVNAEEVSNVLPEAIRTRSKDKQFSRALGPTLSEAFQDSVKRDPQSLADAISPIMGPAIRRSISEQIRAMVQTLNTALDHSLSPRGIGWRIEAFRTGKPFAEVVLLHTLVFRIERLLLIDPQTGLLMQSVSADHADDDADLVSSLLSAIQDFIRDSFEHRTADGSGADLKTMNTNELTIWIEHGPSAILAAAVRGEPPLRIRERLQEVLEQLHINYGNLLTNFRGDTNPLEIVRPDLEDLLESEYVDQETDSKQVAMEKRHNAAPWKRQLSWAIPTCLLLALCAWGLHAQRATYRREIADALQLPITAQIEVSENVLRVRGSASHEWIVDAREQIERFPEFDHLDVSMLTVSDQAWVSFIEAAEAEPGVTIISAKKAGENYVIRGWRDPLAAQPNELLAKFGLDPKSVTQHWEPYHAIDSVMVLRRLKNRIEFPSSITLIQLNKDHDRFFLKGSASQEWLQKLRDTISVLDAEDVIDISHLTVDDSISSTH